MQIQGQYAPHGTTWYNSSAAEEKAAIKSGPGMLFSLAITNSSGSTRYAYLFDSLSATGTTIHPPIPLPTNTQVVVALPFAIPFTTGLYFASSTSNATYTASTASDFRVTALYK